MIEHLFSTPICVVDTQGIMFDEVQTEIENALPKLKELIRKIGDEEYPWIEENLQTTFKYLNESGSESYQKANIINTFNLSNLKELILMVFDSYCKELQINSSEFELVESWLNIFEKENFMRAHSHAYPGLISGVYYYQAHVTCGDIVFENPNPIIEYYEGVEKLSPPGTYKIVESKSGRVIIFPAYLKHRVQPNRSDKKRIGFAFNFRIKK